MLFRVAYPVRFGPEVISMQNGSVCIAPEVISMQAEACDVIKLEVWEWEAIAVLDNVIANVIG